jgi:hypothetical protein
MVGSSTASTSSVDSVWCRNGVGVWGGLTRLCMVSVCGDRPALHSDSLHGPSPASYACRGHCCRWGYRQGLPPWPHSSLWWPRLQEVRARPSRCCPRCCTGLACSAACTPVLRPLHGSAAAMHAVMATPTPPPPALIDPGPSIPAPAAMGAMSLAVTVGSSTAGTASLIMNIVLLIAVVVSGAWFVMHGAVMKKSYCNIRNGGKWQAARHLWATPHVLSHSHQYDAPTATLPPPCRHAGQPGEHARLDPLDPLGLPLLLCLLLPHDQRNERHQNRL